MTSGPHLESRLERLHRDGLGALWRLVAPEFVELHLDESDLARNLLEDPDACPDLMLGAWTGSHLDGAAIGVVRGGIGYIKILVVAPASRRQGVGSKLLSALESGFAGARAGKAQTDGAAPVYLLPGLPAGARQTHQFLEKRGYWAAETRSSMTAELSSAALDTASDEAVLKRQGVTIRRAVGDDGSCLTGVVQKFYSEEWAVEVSFSLRQDPIGTHVALVNGKLAGFAAAGIWARNTFGPMGTLPGYEGRGIGAVLLRRCLADLRAAGEERAVIAWTGPEEFYARKVGARRNLEYVVLEKSLPASS